MIRRVVKVGLWLWLAGCVVAAMIWLGYWRKHDSTGLVRSIDIGSEHWHGKLVSEIINRAECGSDEQKREALEELLGVYYAGSGLLWDDDGPSVTALSMLKANMEKMGVSQRGRIVSECAAKSLGSTNYRLRRKALSILIRMGPERSVVNERLREAAAVEEDESNLLELVLLFRGLHINEEEQIAGNVRLLGSSNEDVVVGAAIRLGEMGQRARIAVPDLESAARRGSSRVDDACRRALLKMR